MVEKNFKKYDVDGDGIVETEEMSKAEHLIALENTDKKEDQLRQMAWVAMISMVLFTALLFFPFLSIDRIVAIDNILSMFYIAQAGVVATFFGANAYMSR